MPKKKPAYLLHKPTGQARCRIDGRDTYLGKYGTPASKQRYDNLVGEWLAKNGDTTGYTLLVDDLCILYQTHADRYYRKDGEPTSEAYNIRVALRYVVQECGTLRAREFGPKALKKVRQAMIEAGCVRTSINRMVGRVRRMFKWAVAEEMIPVEIHQALETVIGLEEGRSDAVESVPVKPVSVALVEAVRPHVSRQVWAAIELQRLTGARPGEILSMRACDLNMSGRVWEYRPVRFKTQHVGKSRIVFLGPKAQAIVRDFLKPDLSAFLLSPADAREEHLAERRANRTTPMTPSQQARKQKARHERLAGPRYTVKSYGRAIRNACEKAEIDHWHPHQLRHNAGTEVRRQYGVEASRVILGHSNVATTEIYAEKDLETAREIMARIG